ncbi:MAG: F0F1 ATP synthase subunit delta [Spartobacteria bacterium]
MKLSRESRRQSKELFDLSMVDGRLDETRLRAIAVELVEKKPRNYVQMLKFITRLARLEVDRHHAVVDSASSLTEVQRGEISSSLAQKFGKITTEFRHSPDLIGGLRVKLGSNVWDGSIQSRLETLKQS